MQIDITIIIQEVKTYFFIIVCYYCHVLSIGRQSLFRDEKLLIQSVSLAGKIGAILYLTNHSASI